MDTKLIDRYDIGLSKWVKRRQFQQGYAKVQYIRYRRFFVLLATRGMHRFFNTVDDPLEPGESRRIVPCISDRLPSDLVLSILTNGCQHYDTTGLSFYVVKRIV